MWTIPILLICATTSGWCLDFGSLDNDALELYDPTYYGEARFFNITGGFNNSLLGVVAVFIGGIILFGKFVVIFEGKFVI